MPRFDYIAVNAASQTLSGVAEGENSTAVGDELRRGGWTVLSVQLVQESAGRLSAEEGVAVAQQLVAATQGAIPLTGALRAFSEEGASGRLRNRLEPICNALEQGQSLDQILQSRALGLPPFISVILKSGLPAAVMSVLLVQTIQSAKLLRQLRARVFLLMSYPVGVFLAICGLWAFMLINITPLYESSALQFNAFGRPLNWPKGSPIKLAVLWSIHNWWRLLSGIAICCGLVVVIARWVSPVVRSWLWNSIPFIGAMYRQLALSDLADQLAIMVECQVPLPQALNWAASGSRDAELAALCEGLSKRIQAGESFETIVADHHGLPVYLEQILRWAWQGREGREPLRGLSQMLRLRAQFSVESAMVVMEPIMMCGSVIVVIAYLSTILPEMVQMFQLFT